MHAKLAIATLLASNLASAAVLPHEGYDSRVAQHHGHHHVRPVLNPAFGRNGPILPRQAAGASPANGTPVMGPTPHIKAPGAKSGKESDQKKGGQGNKKLQSGFIGGGHPGHAQHPANGAGKAKKPKSGKAGLGQPKKAKSAGGQPKAPAQGGKAGVGGTPASSPAVPSAPAPSSSGSGGSSGGSHTGDLTYYTPGLGSCGVTNSESDMIVALAEDMMTGSANPNDNPNCGKSITITYNGVSATATIEDTCPGCSGAGLDLTPALFQKFAPLGEDRLTGATWHFN